MIFLSTGAVLAILALIGYSIFSPKTQKRMQLALLGSFFVAVGTFVYFVRWSVSPTVIFEQMTFYHRIRVTETLETNGDKLRTLILDKNYEGAQYIKSREIPSYFEYQKYWELVRLFCPQLDRAAFLGGGAFVMPTALLDAFPEVQVDVIEIDKKVIETGRRYFRINDYPQMNVVACDARRFLKTSKQKYDFIFGDAYNGLNRIPAHLVTVEYFDIVKGHLSQDGVYMMNIIGSAKGKRSILFQSLVKTLLKVFNNVSVFLVDPDNPNAIQNIIVVASGHDLAINSQTAKEQIRIDTISKLLKGYLRPSQYDISNGVIFTDEKNPIDYVIASTLR
jgi:spermidine synthase